LNEDKKKLKIIIVAGSLVLILLVVFFFNWGETDMSEKDKLEAQGIKEIEKEETVEKKEVEEEPKEVVVEIPKIETNRLKGVVLETKDYGKEIVYKTIIGVGESSETVDIVANNKTIFFDTEVGKNVSPKMIIPNTKITFIGSGKIASENLAANAIVIGEANNIKYSIIQKVNEKANGNYLLDLATGNEKLEIEKNLNLNNAISGNKLNSIKELSLGSAILFTVEPDFEQVEDGLLYKFKELWLVDRKK
jgi:hypothetical protein